MMSPTTSLEVFHTLIDLPCMTAALEVMEKYKNVDLSTVTGVISDLDPTTSAEAFKNAMFRPMFNFFTRAEGGHGDTINRYCISISGKVPFLQIFINLLACKIKLV